eukprot:jgi/Botrbrau1/15025/Bobra.320_2s0005.1
MLPAGSIQDGLALAAGQPLRPDEEAVVENSPEVVKTEISAALELVLAGCLEDAPRYFPDVILKTEERELRAHKAMLAARSDYFSAMFGGSFREGLEECVTVPIPGASPDVVESALIWCYTDTLPLSEAPDADARLAHLLEVMRFGQMTLMDNLVGKASLLLHPFVNQETALDLLQEAMLAGPPAERLADACSRCIALHLPDLANDPLLVQLVRRSADTVEARQEVDTVPLIDDIRFYIAQIHGEGDLSDDEVDEEGNLVVTEWSSLSERQQKLLLLDRLLNTMGLEA